MVSVSVIMGTYNGEQTISRAIDSILSQSFENFELIICDDCSIDGTKKNFREISKKDNRITILTNPSNCGLAYSLNKCIEVSKGTYLVRMDDDDIALPERIEVLYKNIEKSKYTVIGSSIQYFSENGLGRKVTLEGVRTKKDILRGKSFVHPSVIMKKQDIVSVGNYCTSKKYLRIEDQELWLRIYANGYQGKNIQDVLLMYYESELSMKKRKFKYRVGSFNMRIDYRKKLKLPVYYNLFALKPLISGILPKVFIRKFHQLSK